jgi:hypothetical protein
LTADLCVNLEQSASAIYGIAVAIRPAVEAVTVPRDTAVPYAFLIAELVGVAAGANGPQPLAVELFVRRCDAGLELHLRAPSLAGDPLAERHDAAARIVRGMARQLQGSLVPEAQGYAIRFAAGCDKV